MWDATGSPCQSEVGLVADTPTGANDAFLALSKFFVDDGTVGGALQQVAELACQVSPADMAAITMLVEGRPSTGVFTDPVAPAIDSAQYESGHGPCLDAFRHQRVFRIESTEKDDRWPEFARDAAAHGIHSTLSVPVVARGEGLGALNLYARQISAFNDDCAVRMETFAAHAAIVLSNVQVYWDAREFSENLSQAIRSRSTIDQAIGILMASGGHTSDEAFQLLIRASQRENRKLRDIATELVERTVRRTDP